MPLLAQADLTHFDTAADAWLVEGLDYRLDIGASSRDIRMNATITVKGDSTLSEPDANSSPAEWLARPVGGPAVGALLDRIRKSMGDDYPQEGSHRQQMVTGMRLAQLPFVPVTRDDVDRLLAIVRAGASG
ncbi:hypothetical protein ACFWNT_39660 [Streptomyces sp. NPDC058409]|uniref:hypothetical protein n=1 Tax=Streptomyces sp. NPDC058409 TaxID=3346484 RepID=UPI00364C401B